jgi:enoyl-CoA hydratase
VNTVHARREGAVVLWTLDRPKVNALDLTVLHDLDAQIAEVEANAEVRAVVLTGAGRFFVAGADIASMKELTAIDAERFAAKGQAVLNRLARLAVPVIAAVQGPALGGGCELAMACDIILAGPGAQFGQPEVKLGVIPGFGGTQRLARRVGLSRALDLCLTGRSVSADEAVAMGLASRKVEGDPVLAAMEVAHQIASLGPVAVRLCKRALHENVDGSLDAGQAAERTLFGLCFATSDQREGMAAFLEKRAASFSGQ